MPSVRSELQVTQSGTEYRLMEKLLLYRFYWEFAFQKQRQCETLAPDTHKKN